MKIKLLFFGIIRDVIGENSRDFDVSSNATIGNLRKQILENFPKLKAYPNYSIAINEAYADDASKLKVNDVVALIPPVSGG